jgi:hypothetical protein
MRYALLSLLLSLSLVAPAWASQACAPCNATNYLSALYTGGQYNLEFVDGFTIAAWVKFTDTTVQSRILTGPIAGPGDAWTLFYRGDTTKLIGFYGDNVNAAASFYSAGTITDSNWHHIAITFTAVGGGNVTYKFYIDGVSLGGDTGAVAASGAAYGNLNSNLKIGTDTPTGSATSSMRIAYIGIWYSTLTAGNITTLNSAPAGLTPETIDSAHNLSSWHLSSSCTSCTDSGATNTPLVITGTTVAFNTDNPMGAVAPVGGIKIGALLP